MCRSRRIPRIALLVALLALVPSIDALAGTIADSIVIGSGLITDSMVVLPILLRDASGTSLGGDQPVGGQIQSLALSVRVSPPGVSVAEAFGRGGVLQSLVPRFETQVESATGDANWVLSFSKPPPFSLDDFSLVGTLSIDFGSFSPGDWARIDLLEATTALGNEDGTVIEQTATQNLELAGIFLGMAGIFSDGFESGDTSAW